MKKERKSIIDFIRSLFRKENVEPADLASIPSEQTAENLIGRALGEKGANENQPDESGGAGESVKPKESCPYATRRAIVESIGEIRKFADEHKLAASVVRTLLSLLAEIALGALKGRVSREILETLLRAINSELAEERYPADDDGLPHINGTIFRPDSTSIFDVAAEARR